MAKKPRQITASYLRTHCLRLFDEVAATGEEIIITKRGKPVARLTAAHPVPHSERSSG